MNNLDRKFKKELDKQDLRFIQAFEKYLKGIFKIVRKFNPSSLADVENYLNNLQGLYTQRIYKTLRSHANICYNMGRVHGHVEVVKFRPPKDKKLAALPFDTLDIFVIPHEAIKAIDKRQMVLAGNVTDDMITNIKGLMRNKLYGLKNAQEVEEGIANILKSARDRGSLISTTESTYYYNRGRISAFKDDAVEYVQFSAVMDARTSEQCRSRHGLVMRMDDSSLAENTPPLHGRCRSILRPYFEKVSQEMLDWTKAYPLPSGWNTKK